MSQCLILMVPYGELDPTSSWPFAFVYRQYFWGKVRGVCPYRGTMVVRSAATSWNDACQQRCSGSSSWVPLQPAAMQCLHYPYSRRCLGLWGCLCCRPSACRLPPHVECSKSAQHLMSSYFTHILLSSCRASPPQFLAAFGACLGLIPPLLVAIMAASRILAGLARTHMLLPLLGRTSPLLHTPWAATLALGAITTPIAILVDAPDMVNLVSASALVVFGVVAVAALWRRYWRVGAGLRGNAAPFGLILAVVLCSIGE